LFFVGYTTTVRRSATAHGFFTTMYVPADTPTLSTTVSTADNALL
jgi:hypothetical protein